MNALPLSTQIVSTLTHTPYKCRDIFKFRPNDLEGNGGRGGLHFALCKSIVELHGGQIWMHRQSSTKGNIYSFGIPLSSAVAPTVPLTEPYRATPFGALYSRTAVSSTHAVQVNDWLTDSLTNSLIE